MKTPLMIGAAVFASVAIFTPVRAMACMRGQATLFLLGPVQILPQHAIQMQVMVEDDPDLIVLGRLAETNATVSNVIDGDMPYARVTILLETEDDSCSAIGLPGNDRFVIGFLERDAAGAVRKSAAGLPLFRPIPLYFPHRTPDDERRLAWEIDCNRNGGHWSLSKEVCEL